MRRSHGCDGSVVIVVLLVVPLVFLLAGFVLDPALLLADKGRAFAVASAAARAGADEIAPEARRQDRLALDPAAAEEAARAYLRDAGWSGAVHASLDRVVVDVEGFRRTGLLSAFGFHGKRIHATAIARPVKGTRGEEP